MKSPAPLIIAALALLIQWTASVLATDALPSKRILTPEALYDTQILTDPQVSPDGKWVAYVVTTNERSADETRDAIWMVSWDGTQQLPLTNPAHGTNTPRWSPDGRYLAYVATATGTDKSQIMLLDRRGGEARVLTNVSDDIQSYEWSPDSKRLVMVMEQSSHASPAPKIPDSAPAAHVPATEPSKPVEPPKPIVIDTFHFKEDKDGYLGAGRGHHLYVLDIETRKIEPLTTDPAFNEELPAWSPDGHKIAFIRTREKGSDIDGMEEIDLIDAKPAATPIKLQRVFVPNRQKLAWSPDGTTLASVQGAEPKYNAYIQDRLYVMNPADPTQLRSLTDSLDRPISSYAFAKDSASISVIIEDDGTAYPARVDLRSGVIKKLARGNFVVTDLTSAAGHTAFLYSDDEAPAEVHALDGERLRKLTRHNDAFVAGLQLGGVEDMRFNSADGTPIHGLMVKPPGFAPGRKYPTVLWIHGGPDLQDEHSLAFDGYQFKRQLLAASGFVVFGVNYRGSTGRGDAFSQAIFADWGHKEVEDLMAGIDYLVQTGVADPDRLGIGGWSYGGMLTDYTIASNTRFKAALSGAGTGNPLALYGADQYNMQYHYELGAPWRNSDLYIKLAYPLLHADRIHTPTLFMGGDKDFNVPIVGGEQMYLALRTLGVPAELIVYPGQYHTLTRPSFLKDRAERIAAWYGRYLLSSPPQ
jgi:dipeptidyl aminopeptidase/acylaminoacyl peptidase